MRDLSFRCSIASREEQEPQLGTASTVRRFLLLEEAGPWGISALRDSRLPEPVKQHLGDLQSREGVRPLLIRRPAAIPRAEGTQVFHADARTGRLTGAVLPDARALIDTSLAALPELTGPVFAVCTHGRHDACCAERGRPLAAALAAADPARTWEVSHIGGDRFAPNLLVLPGGWYYGRLTPTDAEAFVSAHVDGRVDPWHLRGRSAFPFPVQAAEIHLRRELGELGESAVRHLGSTRDGEHRVVELEVDSRTWSVRVRPVPRTARHLTCRAATESESMDWELVGLQAD